MQTRQSAAIKPDSILGKPSGRIRTRSLLLFSFCTCIAAVLIGRLFYLQIIKYKEYQSAVIEQMVYETTVKASRGNITDRNGIVLATNYTTERIFISPYDMDDDAERKLVATGLSEILGVSYDTIMTKALKVNRKDETIKTNVEKEDADKVRQFIIDNNLTCIHMVETTTRIYPFSTLASHIIGFCGTDGGLYGLELEYNTSLSGVNGKIVAAQDANGGSMPYNYETYIDATNGANLVTTIDYKIQSYLEKYLEEAAIESGCESRACGIVMDPNTGEILAMAVYPSFDLNSPYVLPDYYDDIIAAYAAQYGEGTDKYKSAVTNLLFTMWNNKNITETYEPGSTSKIFTTSMALEENVAKITDMFFCSGSYTVSGWKIKCHKTTGHGSLSFADGLKQSCNPVMMQLSERIGISAFCKFFSAFGLDSKTGIDLPGEASSIYKKESEMKILDLAVYSFGQRYNVTALQQLTAVAAVANGGNLVTPHVVKEIVDNNGKVLASFGTTVKHQVISEKTAETITTILADGVAGGGGAKNAYVKGYSVAAKTGTSEKGTVGNKRIASTVAYAPAEDPQVVCAIIVDEPTIGPIYGSTVAAPYISKLLGDVLPYLGIEPTYTAEELSKMEISLKNYRGMSLDAAIKNISSLGLGYEIIGSGTSVTNQVPPSGSKMSKENGKVILYTGTGDTSPNAKVPKVIGMTAAEANKALTNAGFNIHLTGSTNGTGAVAITQSIAAGVMAPKGTIIEVEFRYLESSD